MKGVCACGKLASGEYPMDECSKECAMRTFALMTSIKNSMERQGSNEITFGFAEVVESDLIFRNLIKEEKK